MAMLPLNSQAFQRYFFKTAFALSFVDKKGQVDYVITRTGSARKSQSECSCENISFDWLDVHSDLEAGEEQYAFAYRLNTPPDCCPLRMRWLGWSRTPIANHNPEQSADFTGEGFDIDEDYLCQGLPTTGEPDIAYPESFTLLVEPNQIHTITFDRRYKHSLTVKIEADCDEDPDFETHIDTRAFSPAASFDCKNPEFDYPPEVLYGDEAADLVESMLAGIPMMGENPTGDLYCFSVSHGAEDDPNTFEFLMKSFRDNSCKLFIVTKATDPIGDDRFGNMEPQRMVLDIRRSDGSCEYGEIIYEPIMGAIVIDHKPWAGLYGNSGEGSGDLEIISDWIDPEYGDPPGRMWHDLVAGETTIMWWDLTDILLDPGNEPPGRDITDIRVRITDNTSDVRLAYDDDIPESAQPGEWVSYDGNWKRSGNVLEQVTRGGQRYMSSNPRSGFANEQYKAILKFIGDNPYDADSGTDGWKIYEYADDTDDLKTSFISSRGSDGATYLHLLIRAETIGHVPEASFPDTMNIVFKSNESLPGGSGMNSIVNGVAVRYDLCDGTNSLPGALTFARMETLFSEEDPPARDWRYTRKLCMTR